MKEYAVRISGFGSAVPKTLIENKVFETMLDTSDEWIRSRTGIERRRIVSGDEGSVSLSIEAAQEALAYAGVAPSDIDLIICASSIPDYLYPANACFVQGHLGATRAAAFDVVAACSGFVYIMKIAHSFLQNGTYKKALIIGTDVHSRVLDWSNRATCVLFGDGAGAMVLEASDNPEDNDLYQLDIYSDGTKADELYLQTHGKNAPFVVPNSKASVQLIHMNGREIYKFSVTVIPDAILDSIRKANRTLDDIDYIIPHQANLRIIEAIERKLNLKEGKLIAELQNFGNTSSASIVIALSYSIKNNKLKLPATLAVVGFGAGLTWGVGIIRLRCVDSRTC